MLNNPADVLSIVLRGTLGRSGRKRARRATRFLTGNRGFLSTSAIIAAAGVAWGIYDTVTAKNAPAAGSRGSKCSTRSRGGVRDGSTGSSRCFDSVAAGRV